MTDRLETALKQAQKTYSDARYEYENLRDIEYLKYIFTHNTVVTDYDSIIGWRSMADVMRLLESGWLEYDGNDNGIGTRYYVTVAGLHELEKWM